LIIAASFSAIMVVGALVLVKVTDGITEASMTRSPSRPCVGRKSAAHSACFACTAYSLHGEVSP
jgi:hypothetical protein